MGRNTQGVRVINLKEGDSIADVTRVVTEEDEEATTEQAAAPPSSSNGQAVEAE
jgi:DNA gyrase subunit A